MAGELTLRQAGAADRDWWLAVRNDPDSVRASRGRAPVAAAQHARWFAHALRDPGALLYVALVDGARVGFGRLQIGEGGVEVSMAVAPEHRRRGYGTALVRALRDTALNRGFTRLWAEARSDNAASRRAFARAGFEVPELVRLTYRAMEAPWRAAPEYQARPEVAVRAGVACTWCAGRHPHRGVTAQSIGGPITSTTWDLHEVPVAGGLGLEECLAADLWQAEGGA